MSGSVVYGIYGPTLVVGRKKNEVLRNILITLFAIISISSALAQQDKRLKGLDNELKK